MRPNWRLVAYTFLVAFFFMIQALIRGQSSFAIVDLNGNGIPMVGNEVFYEQAEPMQTAEHAFSLKNTGNSTQTVSVRKTELSLHTISAIDKAEAFFCTGVTCYPSSVYSGSVVIEAGKTVVFKAQLIEAGTKGESVVLYKFVNNANGDALQFTLRYNDKAMAVNDVAEPWPVIELDFSKASAQTPSFYVHLPQMDGAARFRILNSLGVEIYACELLQDSNKIELSDEMPACTGGLFYVNVQNGFYSRTKKILLTTK